MITRFIIFSLCVTACLSAQEPLRNKLVTQGMEIEFQVDHINPNKTPGQFTEGDDLMVGFRITDTASGSPMKALYPAAWMEPRTAHEKGDTNRCVRKAQTFLSGSLFSRAEIDLNIFYVVVLNRDATLTVVDPLFGFGGSKLLAMVQLPAPGDDWVLSPDQNYLYVSIPSKDQVVVVNTTSWEVVNSIAIPNQPRRLFLQPDGYYLWATHDLGVAAIQRKAGKVAAHITTGKGAHDAVVDHRSRTLFVSNSEDHTVSLIDIASLTLVEQLETGKGPVSLTYSDKAQMVIVAHEGDGSLVSILADTRRIQSRMPAAPGTRQVGFAPDGRLALAVNPVTSEVIIADASRGKIVQVGSVADQPAQISYSEELAYILHAKSDVVYMIPLREIGTEGKPIPLIDFPGTFLPVAETGEETLVTALVQAPGERAVVFPNPRTSSIHYYREGMAAPMGEFNNYGRIPKAVKVLDRSLQERNQAGFYQTTAHVKKPGLYDVVLFMENPRVVHCFQVPVNPDPEAEARRLAAKVNLEHLTKQKMIAHGKPMNVNFRITAHDGKPHDRLTDVRARFVVPGGLWHKRLKANPMGDGVYSVTFTPPRLGYYYVYVSSEQTGLKENHPNFLVLKAVKPQETAAAPGGR